MISTFLVWAFLSFWLWPHMISWTTGFWDNWLASFLVLTWPLIVTSLPLTIATSGLKSFLKDLK